MGWIFGASNRQTQATYLRRFGWHNAYLPGQYVNSSFRRFLRKNLPILEAVIYSDGNSILDVEGNDFYQGFLVYMLRIGAFSLMGFAVSYVLVMAYLPKEGAIIEDNAPVDKEGMSHLTRRNMNNEQLIKRQSADVISQVSKVTSFLLQGMFMAVAVMSRRFRCLLCLLVPSMGLTAGQSYMATELIRSAVNGPISILASNIKSTSYTLSCLVQMGQNLTRDIRQLAQPELGDTGMGNLTKGIDFEQGIEYSSSITQALNYFRKQIATILEKAKKKIEKETMNYINMALPIHDAYSERQNISKFISSEYNEMSNETDQNKTKPTIDQINQQESFLTDIEDMEKSEAQRIKERTKDMSKQIGKSLSRMGANPNLAATVNKTIQLGRMMDTKLLNGVQEICMQWHNVRAHICNRMGWLICGRIKKAMLGFGDFGCTGYVDSGLACQTEEANAKAKEECGQSSERVGYRDGLGMRIMMAKHQLMSMPENFNMTAVTQRARSARDTISSWKHSFTDNVQDIAQLTADTTHTILAVFSIIASFLKLFVLLILWKAHTYITAYLLDNDFDNVYTTTIFEQLDKRRVSRNCEGLLPLKAFELEIIIYKRIFYTKDEFKRAAITTFKALGLVICTGFTFLIDIYMYKILVVLDTATQGSVSLGGGMKDGGESLSTANSNIMASGSGVLMPVLKMIMANVMRLSNVNLSYQLDTCSPHVHVTSYERTFWFTGVACAMLFFAISSGYLLRLRHMILGFFYPARMRRRSVHLYNVMLVNRRRFLTVAKNVLVHRIRQNRLQGIVVQQSAQINYSDIKKTKQGFFDKIKTRLRKKTKVECIICRENFVVPDIRKAIHSNSGDLQVRMCQFDGSAICRVCADTNKFDRKMCIPCLDRNPQRLVQTLQNLTLNK